MSSTGFGAIIRPIMSLKREDRRTDPNQAGVFKVVQCVGTFASEERSKFIADTSVVRESDTVTSTTTTTSETIEQAQPQTTETNVSNTTTSSQTTTNNNTQTGTTTTPSQQTSGQSNTPANNNNSGGSGSSGIRWGSIVRRRIWILMSESHEARQLEIFGSKLFFETNAVAPDEAPGKVAYIMSAQTQ